MLTSGLTSNTTDEWATPKSLFAKLDAAIHFTLDVIIERWEKFTGEKAVRIKEAA